MSLHSKSILQLYCHHQKAEFQELPTVGVKPTAKLITLEIKVFHIWQKELLMICGFEEHFVMVCPKLFRGKELGLKIANIDTSATGPIALSCPGKTTLA